MNYKLIYLIAISAFLSCRHKTDNRGDGKENYIEFYYMPPHEMVSYNYNCEEINSGPLPEGSERDYLKVTDEKFTSKFHELFRNLQSKNTKDYEIDARIELLVHHDGKVDTICMGTAHGIIVNGNLKQDSNDFSKLVTNEIMKNYKPRLLRNKK